jgi:hypothetical protein
VGKTFQCFWWKNIMGETPSGCQTFFPRNVSWRNVWQLPNISPKECFLERCMVVTKHFSQGLLFREMPGGHEAFFLKNVSLRGLLSDC